jgi:hypothetical protein
VPQRSFAADTAMAVGRILLDVFAKENRRCAEDEGERCLLVFESAAIAEPVAKAATSLDVLHWLPVASIPPSLPPPEHTWACTGPARTAASDNENI